MAHQYIYTMQNLRRVHPPNKEGLKGIYLLFYPGAMVGVLSSVLIGRDGQVLVQREGYTTGSHEALEREIDSALR